MSDMQGPYSADSFDRRYGTIDVNAEINKRMVQAPMETNTPTTDCLRTLANYYREHAGKSFANGMDAQAANYRDAATQLEKLHRELPKLPEPKVATR